MAVTCQLAGSLYRDKRLNKPGNLNYPLTLGGKSPKDRTKGNSTREALNANAHIYLICEFKKSSISRVVNNSFCTLSTDSVLFKVTYRYHIKASSSMQVNSEKP